MGLRILEPGLFTLLVDQGRPSTRSFGVPVGGAADPFAFTLGNALVGNAADKPGLEINLAGPTVQADCPLACVVNGAPSALFSDRQTLRAGCTFTLEADEILRIGATRSGMRAYLCVRGGFDGPAILGSRSSLGPVQPDEVLPCQSATIHSRFLSRRPATLENHHVLRILPGAQADWFQLHEFYNHSFRVTPASNRMGLRLHGTPLTMPERELLSEPVCPGTVQVTRDGQCIILGVDGQTIGGYPKIAQVISADADKLAQARPDDKISFQEIGLEEAASLHRARWAEITDYQTRLLVSLTGSL